MSACSPWAKKLIGTALERSAASTWVEARYEWHVVYQEDHVEASETCVCGYEGLRYLNLVANETTGEHLWPVGSCCIERFENQEMADQAADLRALARLQRNWAGRGHTVREDFSRRAIKALERAGAIDELGCQVLLRAFNRGPNRPLPDDLGREVARLTAGPISDWLLANQTTGRARVTAPATNEQGELK